MNAKGDTKPDTVGQGQSSQVISIEISSIVQDPAYQVRHRLDVKTIHRYMEVLKSDNELPPITVAVVKDSPILVDGRHRLAAMEQVGISRVKAKVIKATKQEAMWLAASANMQHGLALKPSEMRDVFRAYVRSGRHRRDNGSYKSYREIGKELSKNHNTIRNWMWDDFKKIAKAIGEGRMARDKDDYDDEDPVPALELQAMRGLGEADIAFRSSDDAHLRGAILERAKELVAQMERAGNWAKPDF